MKYLTYDLLVKAQSKDKVVAAEAMDEWEGACEAYTKHLKKIRPRLPESVRRLSEYCLHDADPAVLTFDKDSFSLTLRLDERSGRILRLDYEMLEPLKTTDHKKSPRLNANALILYDEIDVEKKMGKLVFTHSVLFSEGFECLIWFSALTLKEYSRLQVKTPGQELLLV